MARQNNFINGIISYRFWHWEKCNKVSQKCIRYNAFIR